MKSYYSVLAQVDGRWSVQFGSYDHEEAKDELREMIGGWKPCGLMIIRTDDTQASIDSYVSGLNGGV